jgi:hypothetical protein
MLFVMPYDLGMTEVHALKHCAVKRIVPLLKAHFPPVHGLVFIA